MAKLLLMSVLFATATIPYFSTAERDPKRGLKLAIFRMLVFNAIYVMAVMFIYPRICW